jgi:superfamily II DNA or RNA helicase
VTPLSGTLQRWLEQTRLRLDDVGDAERNTLVFLLGVQPYRRGRPVLTVQVRRAVLEGGEFRLGSVFKLPYALRYDLSGSARDLPIYARRDHAALRLLASNTQGGVLGNEEALFLADTPLGAVILETLLASGRLLWTASMTVLRAGVPLTDTLDWQFDESGVQRPVQRLPAGAELLPIAPPWYVLGTELGRVQPSLSPELEEAFLRIPAVLPEEAAALAEVMGTQLGTALPPPRSIERREELLPYQALLRLDYRLVPTGRKHAYGPMPKHQPQGVAELVHLYGDQPWDGGAPHFEDGVLSIRVRSPLAEKKAAGLVTRAGFKKLGKLLPPNQRLTGGDQNLLGFASEAEWLEFMRVGRVALEDKGIRIELTPAFPYHLADIQDWYGQTEQDGGWFTLDLGVIVDGEQLSLLPILVDLIARRSDLLSTEALAALSDDELLYAALPDGRRLGLPAGRVRAILSVLVELNLRELPPGPLRLPLIDAARLAALEESLRARWVGADELLSLGRRLRDFAGIQTVDPPAGLRAELRPYQLQGLAWLQFLREYGLGGILADDMGLGKAQPLDAGVLTPNGWRRMGELQVGDFVMGRSGKPTQILGVYPQGPRPIYRLTLTDGCSVEADADHLWAVNTPVRKRRGLPERVLSTTELMSDLKDAAGNLKHYLPMVEPVGFAPLELPIDPYTLGALLGDGGLTHGVSITSEDELVEALVLPESVYANHAERLTSTVSTYRLVTPGQWSANPLTNALRKLGLHGRGSRDKFIPPEYLLGSTGQRLALLQGLLDTDGHAGVVVEYISVSEQLARGVVELVQSLGGTARIRIKATTHVYLGERKTGQAWRVTLKLPPGLDPFRLSQKCSAYRRPSKYPPSRGIKSIEYVGLKDAQCIAVAAADHLYVTEAYIVTHNTVQTLAHLLTEKTAGRADRPSLVVAPTSVLGNWRSETARFAPELSVLTLHGPARRADFERIPDFDLILTTYPLLSRDVDALREHEFHLIILDEAQNIKNSRSVAAKAAGSFTARHRLCLTGTPLENHLGELWSQFNFLMPGLLHTEKIFGQLYRNPVEKQGDLGRRAALAARVRPFLLRREKQEVARELPPKTEIPIRLTLEGDQRDLYETVRVTMQERVREELAARGLSRSTIAVLDALLKLRQAVTDPRLVKLEAAHQVTSNAKLDWLVTNLPQMLEEGRRVLIFSAFATLLGHLEDTLAALDIPYAKLTGQTKNRAEQIDSFQGGEKPVFLISLKAGGVGLNLTAADTVIHYDPWWNPAAENQATDRAYRIGQDKPVFVYRLIAAGSVEERILEMQGRKAALAQGVLGGGLSDAASLSAGDLDRLFAPLEDSSPEDHPQLEDLSVPETPAALL